MDVIHSSEVLSYWHVMSIKQLQEKGEQQNFLLSRLNKMFWVDRNNLESCI